ncbi:hypothetical protein GWK47_032052 [Chionoecetes opilio]|uniref:Uncharacterized protein n=1 Tax=Chionoecetes opilio TaxID=41210 RepID=A0A8J5D0X4_CHIOP|nr:hypothetical protein GWK47_032052 [Chionoecetes opilio]
MFDIALSQRAQWKRRSPRKTRRSWRLRGRPRQSCSIAGVDEKLKRATEEKRRKRQRMEMKKKDAAASSSTLDRDVALESSTTSSSSNEETEDDDFKAPTPANVHAVDLLRKISSPRGYPCLGAKICPSMLRHTPTPLLQ